MSCNIPAPKNMDQYFRQRKELDDNNNYCKVEKLTKR